MLKGRPKKKQAVQSAGLNQTGTFILHSYEAGRMDRGQNLKSIEGFVCSALGMPRVLLCSYYGINAAGRSDTEKAFLESQRK
jgi:hypothetical protein